MRHRSFFILFVYFLGIGTSMAEDKALPFDLLGKEFKDIRSQFRLVINYDFVSTDGYFRERQKYQRWFVVDKDRCYLFLEVIYGTISEINIQDPCYSTRENIRIGDSFSEVRAAYSDAEFIHDQDSVTKGFYSLMTSDDKTGFWFDDHEIRQMIDEGQKIEVEDEIVQKMKLWLIRTRIEPHETWYY